MEGASLAARIRSQDADLSHAIPALLVPFADRESNRELVKSITSALTALAAEAVWGGEGVRDSVSETVRAAIQAEI